MLREHVESIRSSLVVADSHAASMRIHRRIQNGTLRRLLSGVYIPTALLDRHSSSECRDIVFIARVCALSLRYPDYVISGVVAAYLLGLPARLALSNSRCMRHRESARPSCIFRKSSLMTASASPPYVFVRAARAVPCLPSSIWVFASRHRRELLLTALAYSTNSTGFPSPAQGWPTRASSIVSVRMSRAPARRSHVENSTRLWLPLPSTPSDEGEPDGS